MRQSSNKIRAQVQSVLLFTDGHANEGIVKKDQLLESVSMSKSGSCQDFMPTPVDHQQSFFEPNSPRQEILTVFQAAIKKLPESPPLTSKLFYKNSESAVSVYSFIGRTSRVLYTL